MTGSPVEGGFLISAKRAVPCETWRIIGFLGALLVFCLADVALLRRVPRVAEALGQSPGGQEVEQYCPPDPLPVPHLPTTTPLPRLLNTVWIRARCCLSYQERHQHKVGGQLS